VWLKDASQQLQDLYTINIVAPNKLLDSYKKYEDVINTDRKQLIKGLFQKEITEENTDKKANMEDIDTSLKKFHIAEYEIMNLSNDIIDFPIFRVEAKELKLKLAKQANDLKNRILEKVAKWCKDSVEEIEKTYIDMRERIMKEPMDESQLVELREFIKKSKEVTIFHLGTQLTEVE
jgi:dynein heavy chain